MSCGRPGEKMTVSDGLPSLYFLNCEFRGIVAGLLIDTAQLGGFSRTRAPEPTAVTVIVVRTHR